MTAAEMLPELESPGPHTLQAGEPEPLVTTFPIGTRSEVPKVGLAVPALIGSVIAANIAGSFTPAINTLDSYRPERRRFIPPYLDMLGRCSIAWDSLWHDAEHTEGLAQAVEQLFKRGYLRAETRDIDCCPCGKVERLSSAKVQPGARLYKLDESGNTTCTECNEPCCTTTVDALVMHFPETLVDPVVEPALMRAEVGELFNRLRGMEYLASRTNRQTGVYTSLDGRSFQLDIDFFWSNYLADLPDGPKLAVGTSHVAWHLALAHALYQCSAPRAGTTSLVLAPYIYDRQCFDPQTKLAAYLDERDTLVPLTILMNLAWSQQNSNWSQERFNFLVRKVPADIRTAVWDELSRRKAPSEIDPRPGRSAIKEAITTIRPESIMRNIKQKKSEQQS
jgi:hypothetical protein